MSKTAILYNYSSVFAAICVYVWMWVCFTHAAWFTDNNLDQETKIHLLGRRHNLPLCAPVTGVFP